jgi:transcriptional regulator with XRE-family HTH domain
MNKNMSNQFGNKIRLLREENNLLLRQVAPLLEIDSPQLSKIERGERQAKKEYIPLFAKIFKVTNNELLTLWLADQLFEVIQGEPMADEALKSVSKTIKKEK